MNKQNIRYSFNDDWTYQGNPVTLPHDAMLGADRNKNNPSGSAGAFFAGGIYTYEKTFECPEEWLHKNVVLQFEGVYRKTKVYVNEQEAGGCLNGYFPFFVDLKPFLKPGKNILKLTADNSEQPNSRWYSGGGIYRQVWLWVCDEDGIGPETIRITTLSCNPPTVHIDAPEGAEIGILDHENVIGNGNEITLPDAKLWSDETPYLYTCRAKKNGDIWEENFGIRRITWSAEGLSVNGKNTLLRGGCIHHDNSILGAASWKEAEWRRVRILKEAG